MGIEEAVFSALDNAIVNFHAYNTVWNKTIFECENFETDIPSGNRHKGHCPFVAFKGGVDDDFTNDAGDLFSGEVTFELMLYVAKSLTSKENDWVSMQAFASEIERAVDGVEGDGIRMKPTTSKDYPESGHGMLQRLITLTIEASECRGLISTDPNIWDNLELSGITWNDLNTTTWDELELTA